MKDKVYRERREVKKYKENRLVNYLLWMGW